MMNIIAQSPTRIEIAITVIQLITASIGMIIAVLAVIGITSWRRSYLGKRKIKLSHDGLLLFYKAQAAINSMRSPIERRDEGESREKLPNEPGEAKADIDCLYAIQERCNKHSDLFSQISSLGCQYLVIFGSKSVKPFADIGNAVKCLRQKSQSSIRQYKYHLRLKNEEEKELKLTEVIEKYQDYCLDYGDENDEITLLVGGATTQMEAIAKESFYGYSIWGKIKTLKFSFNLRIFCKHKSDESS